MISIGTAAYVPYCPAFVPIVAFEKNNNIMAQKLSNYDISQIIYEFADDNSSEIDDNVNNDAFELG